MTTWIDVMELARGLREKRDGGPGLDAQDAERLLAMVLDFHHRVVAVVPRADRSEGAPPRR
jgi:hypothetical protein